MAKTLSRREKVVNTALKLIANGGFHASPMSELAKLSGVAIGTIYHHFPSKEDLFESVYLETCTHSARLIHEAISFKGKEMQRLSAAWSAFAAYLTQDPLRYHVLVQYRNSPTYVANKELEDSLTAVTALIKEGQKSGKMKKLPVPFLFELFVSSALGVARAKVVDRKKISEKEMQEIVSANMEVFSK